MAARRSARPRFSSALIPFIATYVRAKGADGDALAKRFNVAGGALDAGGFRKLMDASAKALGDPLFGLHIAQAMPRGAYGLLEFALRSAPTARVALEQLARYGALINPAARFWVEPSEDEVALHHRLPEEPGGIGAHGNLYTVARLLGIGREMVGAWLTPRSVWLSHQAPRQLPSELAAYFGGARLEFGRSSNGLSFAAADLEQPLTSADPALNAVLREHANRLLGELDPAGIHERTRKAVLALLPLGEVTLGQVAKRLHVSERTLQRRLTEDGVPFAELVAEVRGELARRYLMEEGGTVAEVAQRLGYQDAAAFVRAFKRWTGQTPAAWRAAHAA